MELSKLTYTIIGGAFDVMNTLGSGFLEKVYENALVIELRGKGLHVEQQFPIAVDYKGIRVGDFVADLFVEQQVIVELKAVVNLAPIHEVQLVNYLVATKIDVGLLINFGEQVEIKKKFRIYKKGN
ncbi:MAG: GxxExxY protein [Saprospiraceae bacterium]|nr:GxxExxY protein [Saprospiraceae bacterium]